jgi:hypothetical protein
MIVLEQMSEEGPQSFCATVIDIRKRLQSEGYSGEQVTFSSANKCAQ